MDVVSEVMVFFLKAVRLTNVKQIYVQSLKYTSFVI